MSLELFRKHMNKKVKIKFKNKDGEEDIFEFKPLTVDQFTTFMVLGEQMEAVEKGEMKMSEDIAKNMLGLWVDIIQYSYPEVPKEDVGMFAVSHFDKFIEVIEKLSPEVSDDDKRKKKALEKIKQLQRNGKVNIEPKPVNIEEKRE